jgi:PAS domain S-box-containing protein
MKQKKHDSSDVSGLRKKAEKRLKARMPSVDTMSDSAIQQLVHELQVHQIELEMQNDELRGAQAELEESRTKYSDLYDFSPVGYVSMDKKGLIREANLTVTDLLGIKREQLIDKPFTAYVEKKDIDLFLKYLRKTFKEKTRQTLEVVLKSKSDKTFNAMLESIIAVDSKGNMTCRTSIIDITERIRNEAALRESEKKYRYLFENMLNGFAYCKIVVDEKNRPVDFIYLEINNMFEKYTGLSREDVIEKKATEVVPVIRDSKPDLINLYGKIALKGGQERFSFYFEPFDKWYSVNAYSPEKGYFIAVFDDITEQKRVENALSSSAKINRIFANLSKSLLSEKKTENISDLVLESAKLLTESKYGFVGHIDPGTGYLVSSTMTKDVWDECKVENKDIIFEKFCGLWGWVLDNREPVLVNSVHEDPHSAGTPRGHIPIKRLLSVPAIINGKLVGQIALANKESEYKENDLELVKRLANIYSIAFSRHEAEGLLKASEDKYRRLFEGANDAIYIIDSESRQILDVNENAVKNLGYTRDELLEMTIDELYLPESSKSNENIFKILKDEGKISFEKVHRRKDGSAFPVEIRSRVVEYGNRKVYQSIVRDISDRKYLEESRLKLRNLESLGTLAGGIAHDFNNILMVIFGNIQLARMYVSTEDKIYQNLTAAEKASLTAKALARQLITFSKGDAPVRNLVSLSDVLESSLSIIPGGSSIVPEVNIDKDLWPVYIDEEQIRQVFENLIKNAMKAMQGGGVITIKAENTVIKKTGEVNLDAGRYILISIKDEGVGISDKNLERIFDPYFSTEGMGTQKGLGLGLSISHSIIASHDGLISVRSKEGVGSNFYVYIPAGEKEEQKKAGKPPEKKVVKKDNAARSGKVRILLMDDDESIRHVASDILREVGYDVDISNNGNEAISKYKKALRSKSPFDMVILDLTVKYGMGGKETMVKLREVDPDVRAIISSGYSDEPVIKDFSKYGFKGVLVKPYKLSELEQTLNSVMSE